MIQTFFKLHCTPWCGNRKRPNALYLRIGHLSGAYFIHPLIKYNYVQSKTIERVGQGY